MDFKSGSPNNCTNSSSTSCYRWKSAIDLEMTVDKFGPSDLCISIRWRTQLFDPVVKDCFLIDNQYGRWFGGFGGAASFPIGKHVPSTLYLPGESFGEMADRLWLSTNGVAVVAEADFPLYLAVRKDNSGSSSELCVSRWYGLLYCGPVLLYIHQYWSVRAASTCEDEVHVILLHCLSCTYPLYSFSDIL